MLVAVGAFQLEAVRLPAERARHRRRFRHDLSSVARREPARLGRQPRRVQGRTLRRIAGRRGASPQDRSNAGEIADAFRPIRISYQRFTFGRHNDRTPGGRTALADAPRERRVRMTSKTVRIMIVDDDQDLAESLADLLQVFGYEVDIATNGKDALQRAQAADFDITFMDVRMPVMNGVDSCLAIKRIKPQARIVMMTGYKEPILAKATAAGAEGPLQKPFSPETMLQVVETVR
jgi:CheY-like chemotaxis protein